MGVGGVVFVVEGEDVEDGGVDGGFEVGIGEDYGRGFVVEFYG